jgi:hypothetical protein
MNLAGVGHGFYAGRSRVFVSCWSQILRAETGVFWLGHIGSQANDRWEMKIAGPNGFEGSYTLEGTAGEHRPEVIRVIAGRMVPVNLWGLSHES